MLVSISNKPLQPAIRGFPTSYDSEVRKRCQQSFFRASKHRGLSSYTSFRIEGKDLFHDSDTVWLVFSFQCPQPYSDFTGNSNHCFFLTAGITPYCSEFVEQNRVFPDRPPCTLDEPRPDIFRALPGYPAASHHISCRVLTAGKSRIRSKVLACSEASHVTPLKCQPYSSQPADSRTAFLRRNSSFVPFLFTQCPEFRQKFFLDCQLLLKKAQIHIQTHTTHLFSDLYSDRDNPETAVYGSL